MDAYFFGLKFLHLTYLAKKIIPVTSLAFPSRTLASPVIFLTDTLAVARLLSLLVFSSFSSLPLRPVLATIYRALTLALLSSLPASRLSPASRVPIAPAAPPRPHTHSAASVAPTRSSRCSAGCRAPAACPTPCCTKRSSTRSPTRAGSSRQPRFLVEASAGSSSDSGGRGRARRLARQGGAGGCGRLGTTAPPKHASDRGEGECGGGGDMPVSPSLARATPTAERRSSRPRGGRHRARRRQSPCPRRP
ncbi:hypothetical protein BS78_K235700 [Paspalum vaginatum]|uniref:Uncharacterized protein n=1 Tax=Paspalum vaginatum TaxID=158149 RepID=A0A9W8CD97_9POAL|nr:hypothetical protein BS78_K235700 [Paspalum vaginatum]